MISRKLLLFLTLGLIGFLGICVILADMGILRQKLNQIREMFPFLPSTREMFDFEGRDKVGHFLITGSLALLLNLNLEGRQLELMGRKVYWGSLLIYTAAILEELTQLIFPSRGFDWLDLSAGLLGVFILGSICYPYVEKRIPFKE